MAMLKTKENILLLRNILAVWFILFVLSPCSVKAVLFNTLNSEYSQPLNISKLTTAGSFCQYSQNEIQQVTVLKVSKTHKLTQPIDFVLNNFCSVHSINILNCNSKPFSGNSPPKYILYKRLKLDVA